MTDYGMLGRCPKCYKKQRLILRSILAKYKGRKQIAPPHYQLICEDCGIVLDEQDLTTLNDKEFEAHALHLGKYAELDLYRRGYYNRKTHYKDNDD